ncbi:DNA cytosine methyltransferase [Paenibacillus jilunlii]|uniref:DNA (cytosine-5-)-methyltransferase n=1 Tax=Paenibacillus jilunlii TaxID=682956 RepID=A0A1H0A070_9BACL|nr:DNA cytosine methyltransferase [Paenibacillus jilunlii]KWX79938.1 hypothetical protein AML91_01855 [Paenibacillus jilunlii]SDN27232.1 DNA (cytosine-5)-methyltransferase 1 [Paenibacillus jilunlii]
MNHLSLFSGIGGIDLAAEWAGMKTVAFCEREPYPVKVLQKNFPGVPIYDDVKTLTRARLIKDGIVGNGRTIDVVSAGYPCQPFSVAGQREGENDDRHLWPEVKRLLEEIRPRWFVGENVAGHITMGLDSVLDDLDNIAYSAQPFIIPAAASDAQYERERVFILAYADSQRLPGGEITRSSSEMWERAKQQLSRLLPPSTRPKVSTAGFGRATYGVSRKLDEARLKALGNAVRPQQIYPIMAAIKAIDDALGR